MSKYDIIVLGSGPGGYVTAIRASQLGFKTAVIEKESLGGVCLNWGCIPTKALLKSAQVFDYLKHAEDYGLKLSNPDKDFSAVIKRSRNVADGMSKGVQFLMKKNKIDTYYGLGSFVSKNKIKVTGNDGKEQEIETDKTIIATGSKPTVLPFIPVDKKRIITSTEALELKEVPKHMIIIGGGVIGLELGSVYARLGAKVQVVEYLDGIIPTMDRALGKELQRIMKDANRIREVLNGIEYKQVNK